MNPKRFLWIKDHDNSLDNPKLFSWLLRRAVLDQKRPVGHTVLVVLVTDICPNRQLQKAKIFQHQHSLPFFFLTFIKVGNKGPNNHLPRFWMFHIMLTNCSEGSSKLWKTHPQGFQFQTNPLQGNHFRLDCARGPFWVGLAGTCRRESSAQIEEI